MFLNYVFLYIFGKQKQIIVHHVSNAHSESINIVNHKYGTCHPEGIQGKIQG